MKKIDLICIVSAGHSGSTLLDLILGSQKEIVSVGEIINFKRAFLNKKLCTCGKILENCEYWSVVIREYKKFIETDNKTLFNMYAFNSIKDRIIFYIFNKPSFLWTDNEIQQYGLKNYYLLKSIKKVSGKRIIFDSSKDVPKLIKLFLSGLFNIKIIYLFRDGRDNIESIKRKAKDPKREEAYYNGALFHTISFIVMHFAYWRAIRRIGRQNTLVIRYKDFAMYPKNVLNHICKFIGVDFQEETINPQSPNYFSTSMHHTTGGNRLRLKYTEKITYKKKWTKELNKKEQLIFQLLGGKIVNKIFEKLSSGLYNEK